jgi:hypothetical protein
LDERQEQQKGTRAAEEKQEQRKASNKRDEHEIYWAG